MTKKKKKVNELKSTLVDWAEDQAQMGTPSMVLLPSRNYTFKVSNKIHKITLPKKGTYHELAPNFFSEEDGKFDLYDFDKKILYFPTISKVLYATKKYPDLKDHQLFAPLYMVVGDESVDIFGHVIDMLEPEHIENVV